MYHRLRHCVSEKAPPKYATEMRRQLRGPSAVTAARSFASCADVQALSVVEAVPAPEHGSVGESDAVAAVDLRLRGTAPLLPLPLLLVLPAEEVAAVVAGEGAGPVVTVAWW